MMDQTAVLDHIMAKLGFNQQPARRPAVRIDPNIRVCGGQTIAEPGDISGEVVLGCPVWVYEPEAGVIGEGVAVSFDEDKQLLFIDVDWPSLRPFPDEDVSSPLEP